MAATQSTEIEYYCPEYNCVVTAQPCPHCGEGGHKRFR